MFKNKLHDFEMIGIIGRSVSLEMQRLYISVL